MRQLGEELGLLGRTILHQTPMTNRIICIPVPGVDLSPAQFRKDGLLHPMSVLCPFAVMGLPRLPTGCCHLGADTLVSLLGRFAPKLAERLTHRMTPKEAQRFAVELAAALGEYLERDDRSVAGVETLSHGMLWFLLVSAIGYGTTAVSSGAS